MNALEGGISILQEKVDIGDEDGVADEDPSPSPGCDWSWAL